MAEWPETFVYVCSASRSNIVNVLPMVHGGLQRIARMVVLCGARSEDSRDGTERAEAVDPALRLRRIACDWADGAIAEPDIRWGDPADIACWRGHMTAVCDAAARDGLPVLFNVKGGTKEMAIGGVMASAGHDLRVVTVRGAPFVVEEITSAGQSALPRFGQVSLARYLDAYGLIEDQPEMRQQAMAFYAASAERLAGLAGLLLPRQPGETQLIDTVIGVLNKSVGDSLYDDLGGGRRRFRGGTIEADAAGRGGRSVAGIIADVLRAMDGLPGCRLVAGSTLASLEVTREEAARLLNGGWLEGYVYNRLFAHVGGRDDVEVVANLGLAHRQGQKRAAELDVAVLVKSQLHLIEAKTGRLTPKDAQGSGERSLAQVDHVKKMLLGQVGKALIVNPRETEARADHEGDFGLRARHGGEELFFGIGAIDRLVERVATIVAEA